ncbi:hypothetical protein EVAR_97350_1 [Eumeta japonica]|uniref:Uncharacterized protein n=1 Tax=Eumeta variegata TaxID=151549 RepID=A0A4C1T3Y8_EUMVA|nr:hypothetical protein EVAR_97350_1 [Eumeta japonica]
MNSSFIHRLIISDDPDRYRDPTLDATSCDCRLRTRSQLCADALSCRRSDLFWFTDGANTVESALHTVQNVEFARDARCELEKYQLLSLASTAKDNTVRTLACREKSGSPIYSLSDPVLGPVVAPYLSIVPGSDIVPTLHADPLRLSVRISVLIMISLPLLISASTAYDTSLTRYNRLNISSVEREYTAPPARPAPPPPESEGRLNIATTPPPRPPLNHCVRCTPTLHMLYADRHHRPSIFTLSAFRYEQRLLDMGRTALPATAPDTTRAKPHRYLLQYRQFVIKRNTPHSGWYCEIAGRIIATGPRYRRNIPRASSQCTTDGSSPAPAHHRLRIYYY